MTGVPRPFTISSNWRISDRETFEREVQKCQLLCTSCHSEKTKADLLEMRGPFTHGTIYGWMKMKCKCDTSSAAKRVHNDARNEKRRKSTDSAKGPYSQPADHGTKRRYSRGCKCDLCRAANAKSELEARKVRTTSLPVEDAA